MKWTSWKETKSKTSRKEELKRKEGGNEMNDLKRNEEVNERDGNERQEGQEVT